jgi:hypothetical protein
MNDEYYNESEDKVGTKNKSNTEKKLAALKKKRDAHVGEWITYEDAVEYWERAEKLPPNGYQDIGERRDLRIELQNRFGLSQGEAINILNGYNIRDIVQVYDNLKNLRIHDDSGADIIFVKDDAKNTVIERLESDFD